MSSVDKITNDDEKPVQLCNYVDVYKHDAITGDLNFMHATATADEVKRFTLRRGDVLITKDSETPDDIGVPAVVQEDVPGLICGYHLALVRPNLRIIDGNFLFRSLSDLRLAEQFYVAATGVTRFGLSKHDVKNVLIPVPELVEQRAIAAYLASTSFEVEIIIARTRREIELIREYRTRLIADVVTGKIDVRGHPDAAEDAVFDETMELDADDAFGMRDGDEGLEGEVLPEENQE